MLSAKDIHKRIGSEHVLRGASVEVSPGELVGLIGLSGGGKTVFARCILGLETWERGTVEVDGVTIGSVRDPDAPSLHSIRRKIGLVTQDRSLPAYRSVSDLVAEGPLFVGGHGRKLALEKANRWIEKLGLAAHAHKYPTEISGGQLARLCLARALVMEPAYLICDEMTANLDPVIAAEVAVALLDIVKMGVGVLMISHQLEFLRRYATRIDYLEGGQVVASGSPEEIFLRPSHPGLSGFLTGAALGR